MQRGPIHDEDPVARKLRDAGESSADPTRVDDGGGCIPGEIDAVTGADQVTARHGC